MLLFFMAEIMRNVCSFSSGTLTQSLIGRSRKIHKSCTLLFERVRVCVRAVQAECFFASIQH